MEHSVKPTAGTRAGAQGQTPDQRAHGDAPPIPMFNLTRQYAEMRPAVEAAVLKLLANTQYIGGGEVEQFEAQLGAFSDCRAVAMSNGTDAILGGLMALGIRPGDEVITTPFTFFATGGCIRRLGAKPVFVDIDPRTFLIDLNAIAAALTPAVKCIIPVHLFGQMVSMKHLTAMACHHGITVFEDAAQCIGASDQDGIRPAELGAAAALSFYPTKNLGAAGDAGALLTRSETLAQRFRQTRQHGETSRYMHEFVGGNFRLDAIQCAILRIKLPFLQQWNQRRRDIADFYDHAFAGTDAIAPHRISGAHHVFHQYVLRTARRDALKDHLTGLGIGSMVYYPRPLHLQECFAELGYQTGSLPHAEQACHEVLALPIFPELTEAELRRIANAVRSFFGARSLSE